MKIRIFLLLLLSFLVTGIGAKEVVGWVEHVAIYNDGEKILLNAKIDTGAKTTSIHSDSYHTIKKDGKNWVKFKIVNHMGDIMELEKPVIRFVEIKRHFGRKQVRPVVLLGLCLGNTYQITEVNIVDRSGFNYQLLVGREFLKNNTLVDSSETYTKEPSCVRVNVQ